MLSASSGYFIRSSCYCRSFYYCPLLLVSPPLLHLLLLSSASHAVKRKGQSSSASCCRSNSTLSQTLSRRDYRRCSYSTSQFPHQTSGYGCFVSACLCLLELLRVLSVGVYCNPASLYFPLCVFMCMCLNISLYCFVCLPCFTAPGFFFFSISSVLNVLY